MRKRDREKFATKLNELRKGIMREIKQVVKAGREGEAGDGRDTYDIASDERDREITMLLGDRERKKLAQIDAALQSLEAGEYGVCDECGEDIAGGRLDAMPFSRLCGTCQHEFEQTQRTMQSDAMTVTTHRLTGHEGDDDAT